MVVTWYTLHYFTDITYKTVKQSHLEKLQIKQNINKQMFQVFFIFSDWTLIEQIIAFSTHSVLGGNKFSKNYTWRFEWRTRAWVKLHRFNEFSRDLNTINWKFFPTYVGIYKSEKIGNVFWSDKTLRSLKKYERMYLWG